MSHIVRPLVTEKSAADMDNGLYVFSITPLANKRTVKAELKAVYGVDALEVRIVNLPAKKVVFKRRKGERSVRRKAYVQLPPKTIIPGFEILKGDKKADTKKESK